MEFQALKANHQTIVQSISSKVEEILDKNNNSHKLVNLRPARHAVKCDTCGRETKIAFTGIDTQNNNAFICYSCSIVRK